MSLEETEEEKADLKDLWLERWSDKGVVLEVPFCSRYKPLWTSPTPIVFNMKGPEWNNIGTKTQDRKAIFK